jgi:hypothetical protein
MLCNDCHELESLSHWLSACPQRRISPAVLRCRNEREVAAQPIKLGDHERSAGKFAPMTYLSELRPVVSLARLNLDELNDQLPERSRRFQTFLPAPRMVSFDPLRAIPSALSHSEGSYDPQDVRYWAMVWGIEPWHNGYV